MNHESVVTDTYEIKIEEHSGLIFLHLHFDEVNKTLIKDLRNELQQLKDRFVNGHDVIFATSPEEKTLKLWNMIEPCYEVKKLDKDVGWLGSWLTEEI